MWLPVNIQRRQKSEVRSQNKPRGILNSVSWLLTSAVLGDSSEGVPPVPIPNTEVKPYSPDGTARASVWESRKLPGLKTKAPARKVPGAFCFARRNRSHKACHQTAQRSFSKLSEFSRRIPRCGIAS